MRTRIGEILMDKQKSFFYLHMIGLKREDRQVIILNDSAHRKFIFFQKLNIKKPHYYKTTDLSLFLDFFCI